MDLPDFRGEIERKDSRELLYEFRYGWALSIVFLFALWIRMIPGRSMKHLQALDPYMIARMSQAVVKQGKLPLFDVWRYFPFPTPTFQLNLGDIFIPAYLFKLFSPFMDFAAWTQFYPALAGSLMVVAMYFIGKELFNRQTGLLAAFFLTTAPGVLHRSSAGWFEKEPLAAFLMLTSTYFVVRAWKRKEWASGVLSGTAMGIALTAWGGAQFLVLLYPIVMFAVAFIDEDIENLIVAFTPTIILGHFLPAILNPFRWSVPNGVLVMSLGILGIIWIRYFVERRGSVSDKQLKYIVPGLSGLGGILLFLSPLYSQTLAGYAMTFYSKAAQGAAGGVVGGTVAENQPASAGQIIGQLGAFRAQQVLPAGIASASEFFSGWTFSLIGTSILLVVITGMMLKKYRGRDKASSRTVYLSFLAAFTVLALFLVYLLPGSAFTAFLFAFVVAVLGAGLLMLAPGTGGKEVEEKWYLIIPLAWILSTLFGASQRSRLLFLASHPVALMAGYGLSVGLKEIRSSPVWDDVKGAETDIDPARMLKVVLALILIPVLLFNISAAYGMAQGIGGSPNQLWMENLDFMREETPRDSVVLSWWDYGYWFETIGARAAIADGGNMAFYNDWMNDSRVNFPLADFLTSEDYTKHLDWLQSLSVDYVVLDSTMIGKYSAVSQIHNRDNTQFNSMQTISCNSRDRSCVTTSANNNTYLIYEKRGTRFLVPFKQGGGSIEIDGAPLLQRGRSLATVSNVCSSEGIREVEIRANSSAVPGCVAFHPQRRHQTLVYIPPQVMESTLVNLYIMDAHGMEHFEEVFDNGYVKMWKVEYNATAS